MKVSDFDYSLPEELIAQEPTAQREVSRLLHLPLDGSPFTHNRFADILNLLNGDELLVLNDTRVIKARLEGHRPTGGKVEALLVSPHETDDDGARSRGVLPAGPWRCMVRPARRITRGQVLIFDGDVRVEVLATLGGGEALLDFSAVPDGNLLAYLERAGQVPLPPYIRRPASSTDELRYQTVYGAQPGAVAAPTAGLHFTKELLEAIGQKGCKVVPITLHVGPGTFRPVKSEEVEGHSMHEEIYHIPEESAASIVEARQQGRPVLAIGTTVVRALEAASLAACKTNRHITEGQTGEATGEESPQLLQTGAGATSIFIYPGYRFRVVDALLTNFHLPRSTLLMLVSALVGKDRLLDAYQEAIGENYRFFSYGDAMLIR